MLVVVEVQQDVKVHVPYTEKVEQEVVVTEEEVILMLRKQEELI
tara:strand:- start:5 stop:136 length:132 start_codon:yes stop_codon:yes gene_type:complete